MEKKYKFSVVDICTADYLTDHTPKYIPVFWDGDRLTYSDVREKIVDEWEGQEEEISYSEKVFNAALAEWDKVPGNEIFIERDEEILQAVNEEQECTTIWFVITQC